MTTPEGWEAAGKDETTRGLTPGQSVFGRFVLINPLGRGPRGVVWRAYDQHLRRDVAIKFLPYVRVHDQAAVEDLRAEARRSIDLKHQHIVRIYDFMEEQLLTGIVMEYVDGETLEHLRNEQPRRTFEVDERFQKWTLQLCEALVYVHEDAKLFHLGLSPSNLMVDGEENLKIADFGVSRRLQDTTSRSGKALQWQWKELAFLSPQQIDGKRPSHLDDVYAVGATLFSLLTGKAPFFFSKGDVGKAVQEETLPSMAEYRRRARVQGDRIPEVWEKVVAACMAKDPSRRPQSVRAIHDSLSRAQLSSADAGPVRSGSSVGLDGSRSVPLLFRIPRSLRLGFLGLLAGTLVAGCLFWWVTRRPSLGSVELHCEQAGVTILVRDEPSGKERTRRTTPLTDARISLPAGKYRFIAQYPGWKALEQVVSLKGEAAAFPVVFRFARVLEIDTVPSGAVFDWKNSNYTTRCVLKDVGPGPLSLTFRKEGYLDQRVEVQDREAVSPLRVALRPESQSAPLHLIVNPPHAQVSLPGMQPINAADLKEHPLRVGNYRITISAPGYKSTSMNVTVSKGNVSAPRVDLEALPISVELAVTPTQAAIEVNGQPSSQAKLRNPGLPPGEHTVVVSNRGYAVESRTISLKAGQGPSWSMGSIALSANPVRVLLKTVPEEVMIRVDGHPIGREALEKFGLPVGHHNFELSASGYEKRNISVDLVPGAEPQKIEIALMAVPLPQVKMTDATSPKSAPKVVVDSSTSRPVPSTETEKLIRGHTVVIYLPALLPRDTQVNLLKTDRTPAPMLGAFTKASSTGHTNRFNVAEAGRYLISLRLNNGRDIEIPIDVSKGREERIVTEQELGNGASR